MKPGTLFSGGAMRRPHAARPHHRIQAPPGTEFSGGVMRRPQPARKAGHAKKARKIRGLSAGDVQCCAAEALAASLRLAGGAVSDADVLALYWHTADGPDAGASILATLEAAAEHGLGGVRPVVIRPAFERGWQRQLSPLKRFLSEGGEVDGVLDEGVIDLELAAVGASHGLIVGVDLPGAHTVLDDGEAWWSWGEPFDPASFPHAVIEEAWEVRWAA